MRRSFVAIAIVAVSALACVTQIAPSPLETTTSPSAETPAGTIPRPTLTPSASSPVSLLPTETPPAEFGPLAVYEVGGVVLMDGVIHGTLRITDTCVFIEAEGDGERELVLWPQAPDHWRWDPASGEIVSLRVGSEVRERRFGSGDRVTLGGGDVPSVQDDILESLNWLAPPRDDCMTPVVFFSNGEISPQWEAVHGEPPPGSLLSDLGPAAPTSPA